MIALVEKKWNENFTARSLIRPIHASVVDSTNVLCPLFDEIEILTSGDSSSIFPSLDKM